MKLAILGGFTKGDGQVIKRKVNERSFSENSINMAGCRQEVKYIKGRTGPDDACISGIRRLSGFFGPLLLAQTLPVISELVMVLNALPFTHFQKNEP
jgi:hypothetical protein